MGLEISNHFYSKHLVQFYETDLMGIVHHTNYLRFMEEARVAWAHHYGLIDYQAPQSAAKFAVLETHVKHIKPAVFGDELNILLEARRLGHAKVQFQYQVRRLVARDRGELLCTGQTVHVALDSKLRPMKIPTEMKLILEKQRWTETWLSNLSE
ncbi:MAG: acyl-CoA thioesterase [Bdellovibrionaceae bacterium]|nr:acyl-CoA thioesterase [Pseudobdellovibrionaceae bacterium]